MSQWSFSWARTLTTRDDQDHPLTSAAKGASSLGGGLFGGLELMIKEARKSADVSLLS